MRMREILTEAPRRSVLYHGTSIEALSDILVDGHVNASEPDDYDDGYAGVSLTSSLAIARKFADEAKERCQMNGWDSPVNDGAVLVFDAEAIRRDVGASRVQWDGSRSEREHRTHGPIPDVLKYLVAIKVDPKALQWWITTLEEDGHRKHAAALQAISRHLL